MYYNARSRRGGVLAVMTRVVYTRCKRTLGFDVRADRRGVHVGMTSVDATHAFMGGSDWYLARRGLRVALAGFARWNVFFCR